MIFHFGFGRIIGIIIKGNKRLKKLVIKTACITLAVIISISFICFGAIALFFPKSMAGICEKVGLENAAFNNYVKVYEKSNDIEDLFVVVNKSAGIEKYKIAYEYVKEFVEKDEFVDFVTDYDESIGNPEFTTKEYVLGLYVVDCFYYLGVTYASDLAEKLVLEYGYTEYGPFSALISSVSLTQDQKTIVRLAIERVYSKLDTLGKAYAGRDINLLKG